MIAANTAKVITVKELMSVLQGLDGSLPVFYPDWWVFSESSQWESDYLMGLSNVEVKNGQVQLS